VGIIALVRKAGKRGLAIAAIIVSVLAFIISIIVLFVSIANAVDDAFDEVGTGATVKQEATDHVTSDGSAAISDESGDNAAAGALDSPIAAGAVWEYDSSWFGEDATVWDGIVLGVTEVPVNEYSAEEGTCYAILGTLMPTSLAEGESFTSWIDAPSLGLIVNGTVQDEFGFCDTDQVEDAGFGNLLDVEVGLGTEFKFYSDVFVPATVTEAPDLVAIGDASSAEALYVTATPYELP